MKCEMSNNCNFWFVASCWKIDWQLSNPRTFLLRSAINSHSSIQQEGWFNFYRHEMNSWKWWCSTNLNLRRLVGWLCAPYIIVVQSAIMACVIRAIRSGCSDLWIWYEIWCHSKCLYVVCTSWRKNQSSNFCIKNHNMC